MPEEERPTEEEMREYLRGQGWCYIGGQIPCAGRDRRGIPLVQSFWSKGRQYDGFLLHDAYEQARRDEG